MLTSLCSAQSRGRVTFERQPGSMGAPILRIRNYCLTSSRTDTWWRSPFNFTRRVKRGSSCRRGITLKNVTFRRWLEGKSVDQIEREICGASRTQPESVKQWIREWERGCQGKWEPDISAAKGISLGRSDVRVIHAGGLDLD